MIDINYIRTEIKWTKNIIFNDCIIYTYWVNFYAEDHFEIFNFGVGRYPKKMISLQQYQNWYSKYNEDRA